MILTFLTNNGQQGIQWISTYHTKEGSVNI